MLPDSVWWGLVAVAAGVWWRRRGIVLRTASGRRLRLGPIIGRGGGGVVYSSGTVAIKVLKATDATGQQRFLREIGIGRALSHPHLVSVQDWGMWDGRPFVVMPRLAGTTLEVLLGPGPQSCDVVAAWLQQLLSALQAAHAAGVLHRDIKPANILITEGGAVLMDFGTAWLAGAPTLTGSQEDVGTPRYMSPEHLQAHAMTEKGDLYSLGVVMYEALTGQMPYPSVPEDLPSLVGAIAVSDVRVDVRERRPDVPPALAGVVMGLVARHPRFQTAAEALQEVMGITSP